MNGDERIAEPLLSASEFYTQVAQYMDTVDPSWATEGWTTRSAHEREILGAALGAARGRSILDCSCGTGVQAVPLAQWGWRVTATDLTDAYLEAARAHAHQEDVKVDFHTIDMRDLSQHFAGVFDCAISCMALDNLSTDEDLQRALAGMYTALKPDGVCYLRLRDLEHILRVWPRYDVHEERILPNGRVLRLEDWEYESATHVICAHVFLREDRTAPGHPWQTAVFRYRRRVLRRSELEVSLHDVGFRGVTFLPQSSRWRPFEVLATKSIA